MKRDTIIIFEDNAIDRSILVELFRSEYKILEAENGKVGIELLKNNLASVAIVLLDNVMPVMDGFAVLEYLKERNVAEDSREPLFTHIRGDKTRVLDVDGVYATIKDIARRAGMDRRVYPHLFRKTTATNICKRGGSVDAAGEYLGHAPRNVTDRHYTYRGEKYVEQIFHNFVEAV